MKKQFLLVLAVALLLVGCKTREKVVYLQDTTPDSLIVTRPTQTLKLAPGDKVGVTVTSSATPDLATRYNLSSGTNTSTTQNADNLRYTVDENGNIDMLGIGRINIGGLTRAEAAAKIQGIFRQGTLNDAVVTVSAYNQYITVLGDVSRPGRINITRDNLTILEAIGSVGDLNITGRRDAIKVFRQEGGETKVYHVDIRSKDVFNSPVYNLQQNDVVYVEPNKVKMGQSTNNDNTLRQLGTWLSIQSTLTSLAILIFR